MENGRPAAYVTGIGMVSPLGVGRKKFWSALLAGESGAGPITLFDPEGFEVRFAAECTDFDPKDFMDRKIVPRLDRFAQMGLASSRMALEDAGAWGVLGSTPERVGLVLGSGLGGVATMEQTQATLDDKGPGRVNPFVIPKMIANSAAGNVSIKYGLMGPNTTVVTACSSAAHAMGDAMRQIAYGFADVMISGGTEAAVTPIGLAGFINCKALSERNDDPAGASRPWDTDRDGFVLSEGAGVLVLEEFEHARRRGAPIYCEVLGCGNTADAYHITAPHEDGAVVRHRKAQARSREAMRLSRSAGLVRTETAAWDARQLAS